MQKHGQQLMITIESIHTQCKGAYGSPRIVRALRALSLSASKPRVESLMRERDICARHKQRYKATTDSKHGLSEATNLLERKFTPSVPNQVRTSNITYLTQIRYPLFQTFRRPSNAPLTSLFQLATLCQRELAKVEEMLRART
ncbi:IS3 family transposase [Undibacterium sp.]|uniref:IS3 family transposase n=1 Tax=Undibacterium sp. TaxID=1914977 RepID=UPI0037507D99